jgi:hypothetical protein
MKVNGKLHAQAALPPGHGPILPFNMRLGGLQSRSGRLRGDNIFFNLAEKRTTVQGLFVHTLHTLCVCVCVCVYVYIILFSFTYGYFRVGKHSSLSRLFRYEIR